MHAGVWMSPHEPYDLSFQYQPLWFYHYCDFLESAMGFDVIQNHEDSEVYGQFIEIDGEEDGESTVIYDGSITVDEEDDMSEDDEISFDQVSFYCAEIIDLTGDTTEEEDN
jgi:hypothetical protein